MTDENGQHDQAGQLRQRAEEMIWRMAEPDLETLDLKDARHLIHELRVHQIELEIQNEELRRAQAELETSRARYVDLYDFAPVGYCTISGKSLILEANLTAATLLNVARGALVRQPITRFILKEDQNIYYFHRKALFETGEPQVCELRMMKKDGAFFWARLEAALAQDDSGAPVGRVVLSDVTDRKEAEEALRRSEAEARQIAADLEHSNQALEQFAYAVSHDLQAPLRAVSGYLSFVSEWSRDQFDAQSAEFIQHAVEEVARMQAMIGGILDLSRVTSRGSEFAATDCEALLDHVLWRLQSSIEDNNAVVTHDALPTIYADEPQLGQVLQNLIENALKFHRPGEPPQVHVGAGLQGSEWRFSVRDHGIGLDPAQADRLFQLFARLHTRDEYPGLGLGLALCRRIVERHGGRIWVESEPGQGATFCFTLPA
jgi:PAS domain S-box-containing protein